MASYFVDTGGNDANDGLDNIGVNLAGTVIWTEGILTITEAAGHGYTFAAGDLIYIDGGTGATVGLYEVASSTATTIVLVETSTLPGVGNASDFAAGDLATGDITSSDGPWITIDKAMNTVAAGDVVWINAGTYTESPAIDTVGTNAAPIQFAGYTTTIGDRGRITLVGGITDSIVSSIYYVIENFDVENGGGSGVSLASDFVTFKNCNFHDCSSFGADVDVHALFQECDFMDNAGDGCDCAGGAIFVVCRFYRNGVSGIDCSGSLVCYNCVFFSNVTNAIDGAPANGTFVAAFNCTIDGDGKDTDRGVFLVAGFASQAAVANCVIYDCGTGMEWKAGERSISLNNLLNSNTANYADQAGTWTGEQTGSPAFEAEGSQDYRPGVGSNMKNTGIDINDVEGNTAAMDIGALQEAAGTGGGLLMANKRANKQ